MNSIPFFCSIPFANFILWRLTPLSIFLFSFIIQVKHPEYWIGIPANKFVLEVRGRSPHYFWFELRLLKLTNKTNIVACFLATFSGEVLLPKGNFLRVHFFIIEAYTLSLYDPVCPSVGSVGPSVGRSDGLKKREVSLQCFYRSTC